MGVFGAIVLATTAPHSATLLPLSPTVQPQQVTANGYETAEIEIDSGVSKPALSISENPHGAVLEDIRSIADRWRVRLRAGINPGRVRCSRKAAVSRKKLPVD